VHALPAREFFEFHAQLKVILLIQRLLSDYYGYRGIMPELQKEAGGHPL
jgi:hypothetical protein